MPITSPLENVLVLQGGGSLGAFGCGVFKALANNNVKLDIVAGTSVGGINAAIIAGSTDDKHPEKALEQFWLEITIYLGCILILATAITRPTAITGIMAAFRDQLISITPPTIAAKTYTTTTAA